MCECTAKSCMQIERWEGCAAAKMHAWMCLIGLLWMSIHNWNVQTVHAIVNFNGHEDIDFVFWPSNPNLHVWTSLNFEKHFPPSKTPGMCCNWCILFDFGSTHLIKVRSDKMVVPHALLSVLLSSVFVANDCCGMLSSLNSETQPCWLCAVFSDSKTWGIHLESISHSLLSRSTEDRIQSVSFRNKGSTFFLFW